MIAAWHPMEPAGVLGWWDDDEEERVWNEGQRRAWVWMVLTPPPG